MGILFLGVNIHAIKVDGRFRINVNHTVNYDCDSKKIKANYHVLSKAVSRATMLGT